MDQVSVTSAYMWAVIITAVGFFVAIIAANLILFKPNNPGTSARRIWFWVLCALSVITGFIVNSIIASGIAVPSIKSEYIMHAGFAAVSSLALYVIVGFIVSKLFPNSKVGTWF